LEDWRAYQEEAAKLFRSLGCDVDTDYTWQGARTTHDLDLSIRFSKWGIQQHWIVECKYWKRRIPKERVAALITIVEDIGADRGL
jgi:Restriction endonuclease